MPPAPSALARTLRVLENAPWPLSVVETAIVLDVTKGSAQFRLAQLYRDGLVTRTKGLMGGYVYKAVQTPAPAGDGNGMEAEAAGHPANSGSAGHPTAADQRPKPDSPPQRGAVEAGGDCDGVPFRPYTFEELNFPISWARVKHLRTRDVVQRMRTL